jgi:hypothetical protein
LEAGTISQFPAIIWVDANERKDGIDLIFATRIEGQGAAFRITLTLPQWKNLTFLADGPETLGPLTRRRE